LRDTHLAHLILLHLNVKVIFGTGHGPSNYAVFCNFIPLELNILLSSLISNTETHYIFLNAEDQVYCRYDALEIAKRTRQFAL
jgi:hypothetical protein